MAMFFGALVGKCVERIAASVEESATLVLGIKDDLEDLARKLQMIQSVLKDAERRRFQDKAVDLWLKQLKDVMYDAEDILDHCNFKRPRWLEDHPTSSSASPVRSDSLLPSCISDVSFRHEIGQNIKKLNDRLERIGKDKDMFMFTVELSKPDDMSSGGVNPRQTSPLEEEDVVGGDIQMATNQLAELIIGEEKKKCRVFAIVGMGGIGKTTLAQKLYNDPRIKNNFQKKERIWVCISQSFSETDLLKEIISGAGGYPEYVQSKARLLPMLMDTVKGKRLFLVLDDVWGDDVWVHLLRNPLRTGAASCTIVVTTRNEDVARGMGAEHVHRVEELSIESGWEMLHKRVFINGEEEIQSLKDIGIEIVKKCQRLPLTIVTIAGVLSKKDGTRREWEKVVGSDAWSMSQLPEELRGALYLSYEDLPSHLKQCFLYLSLFPEDYYYRKSELVRLWIAEGFVETHGNSLEDTAEDYYLELLSRSILKRHLSMYYCKMHDLLRSLGCFLTANECFCGSVERISSSVTSQFRRMCIEGTGDDSVVLTADSISRDNRLRTLLLSERRSPTVENDLISRLGHLRVLYLHSNKLDRVPYSIGDLIHLRYLNLQNSGVSELPESLGRLVNLQFLNLLNCKNLHILPEGITRLCNLRSLHMDYTPISYVPKGIGKLQLLNDLNGIVLGEDDSVPVAGKPQQGQGCDLEDLRNLSQLRSLKIRRLEKSSTGMMALESKSHLKELILWTSKFGGQQPYTEEEMGKIVKIEKIFNELTPPSCLESLTLGGFFGCSYPSWMSTSLLGISLPHLTHIHLVRFTNCTQIPPLGELPQLRDIIIGGAHAVVTIGPEFIGSTSAAAFPKLERLCFDGMADWEEWSLGGEIAGGGEGIIENRSMMLFPRLQKLTLYKCPNLRSSLPISSFPALKSLEIRSCPALKVVGSQNALQELKLFDSEMECLPEWLKQLLQQRLQPEDTATSCSNFRFEFYCNDILLRKCLTDGPEWPIIQQIPQVHIYTREARFLDYTKDPFSYKTTNI